MLELASFYAKMLVIGFLVVTVMVPGLLVLAIIGQIANPRSKARTNMKPYLP